MRRPDTLRIISKTLLLSLFIFSAAAASAQDIFISEVVPDNGGNLLDEDGDSSDWIELYNHTASSVDLTGWRLTDTATFPSLWTFPATNIAPGGFLTVFASDKDRSIAGKELHTNFKLKASGEYLALIRPDNSVADSFTYPELDEDESFGRPFTGTTESVLLNEGAVCTFHIPQDSTDQETWKSVEFDDGAWSTGITGIGFDARSGFENQINTSLHSMRYLNTSAYVRIPFYLPAPESVSRMELGIKYDDGFMAYLNGNELLSENTDGTSEWNSGAGGPRNDLLAMEYEVFDLTPSLNQLRAGTNWLAIHLLNDSTDLQDALLVPKLTAHMAGGFNTGAPVILETATPGRPNTTGEFDGLVEPPTLYPQHGIYDTEQNVVISGTTSNSIIRYTLDGSEPTTNSTLYTQPIPVSSTTTIRAAAFLEGKKPSFSRTETYLFLNDIVAQPQEDYTINRQRLMQGMDPDVTALSYTDASNRAFTVTDALTAIPSICITTDPDNLFDPESGIYVNPYERWECPASLELINPDGSEGIHINAGLRLRGGASRTPVNPKHSFRFFFRNEYGASKLNYPLFEDEGTDEFDKLDFRSAQNYAWSRDKDPRNTFMRDVFCRDAAGAMGQEYTRSRFYHLYLNGIYWGLFMSEERPEARHAAMYFGGNNGDYDTIKRKSGRNGVEATDGNLHAFTRLFEAAMAGFTNNANYFAVQGMNPDGSRNPDLERLVDLENMIDYLLVIYYSAATDNCISWFMRDSSVNNMYAVYNRNKPDGFKWFQHDCEHSFDTSVDLDRTGPLLHENFLLVNHFNAQTLHEKLCANPEYRLAFADRVYKHLSNEGALMQHHSEARLDARMAQIDRAIVANAARWGNRELNRDCWIDACINVRDFLDGREEQVIGYLRKDGLIPSIVPPDASHLSGPVASGTSISLSSAEGTIYYTLDGSDPRAIGGAVSGSMYTGPITITHPTIIRARAREADGEWSAENELVFWTPDIPLAFTEVMYHAPSNQLDFVELKNSSDQPVSLSGYALGKGIKFEFDAATLDAGAYVVITKDTNTFLSAYTLPDNTLLYEYADDLDNSGEFVSLKFAGKKLYSISYSDARNWPQAADGGGHSLIPTSESMGSALNSATNWRASAFFGGSPGAEDLTIAKAIVINEVTAHTDIEGQLPPFDSNDQIELYNTSSSAIDISGWYLSDELDNLHQWTIPEGTTLSPGEFIVFDEDDFHPGRTNGFGLNKAGETVVLSNAGRIVDAIRFKGQENGLSLGRYPDGEDCWTPLTPSPGSANIEVRIPVHIADFEPTPANNNPMLEYVRIENTTDAAIQFQAEGGNWRMDGGISYTFGSTDDLAPNETAYMVPFDPETEPELLAQFCLVYNLSLSETFYGPFSGKLANEGERIGIEYPQASDDPEKPEDISWVVVDEVFY